MDTRQIHYQELKKYKYRLAKTAHFQLPESLWPSSLVIVTGIEDGRNPDIRFIELTMGGQLTIYRNYMWDGASGPTIDTDSNMRASLVHDALYQLMRIGHLDRDKCRKPADKLFRKHLKEDGMNWFRRLRYYQGVNLFGGSSTEKSDKNYEEIYLAPDEVK